MAQLRVGILGAARIAEVSRPKPPPAPVTMIDLLVTWPAIHLFPYCVAPISLRQLARRVDYRILVANTDI